MSILILLLVVLIVVLGVADIRRNLITKPVFGIFKKILPPLSDTEREAMEAGDVWWDGDLFQGKPDWKKLHAIPKAELSVEEQAFMDNEVETLLKMLDDYKIVQEQRDLPPEVWQYIKDNGFFAMIIPKSYGGREFSAIANSTIVSRIATRSLTAAVTVMVPNSLGPGELLMHYGTQEQKDRWLPGLAAGKEVPCFALTGPEAGSDAGGIPDTGVICKGQFEGKEVLGIRLNWDKRYITLAPVATVLGLAFKLYDPENLLGEKTELGITCALIPTSHEGVQIGDRHFPMNMAFMNGTTYGKDVFIPLDWIIGGPDYAGRGWRMLVECLSAGRGISLPALATATGHLATRMTGAYSYVRQQFGMAIGKFEGVQESLGRIGAYTYSLEAMRVMTAGAIDLKLSPSVVTAIAKYHMTEMSRTLLNDAFDIHSGRAIQVGPKNYLAHGYMGMPVSITVEGANILTRNLMIFGQGATRCHPYVLQELEAAANPNAEEGLQQFDSLLMKHIGFALGNTFGALWQGLTLGRFNSSPVSGETAKYYKQLSRMSRALALSADFSMLMLGGDLKRKEMLSARLGDVLSHLYIASAVLKFYEDNGRQVADLPFVRYSIERNLFEIGKAFSGFFQNFPSRVVARLLKTLVFPFGIGYKMPADAVTQDISDALLKPGVIRDRLTHLCFIGEGDEDPTGLMESAFVAVHDAQPIMKKIYAAQKQGSLPRKIPMDQLITKALDINVVTADEAKQLVRMNELRFSSISVDSFKPGVLSDNAV
ncbi:MULTISPECIES: acyl-CoA dehydrogenase [Rheinheimera]|uniref:Acyl-coenzyme A dehydrogenase n=1 Tax=Rheinheimera tangshanensis TaxID=400153 RepID=A0A5C8LW37_9GAMM|nr:MULTISPECIES: acyl-CoA dehydrogenase [Rheinheimera]KOO56664.1 acyl-CoA dehydrogenase [Rheinheimera sp. KL1]TXK81501.1 acyl-CoA dehydrogenase [Rheinheimera tangshanensis]GGM57522.1 acyl-CoA dehydrogenase [Rheinheimera tangshanensis]